MKRSVWAAVMGVLLPLFLFSGCNVTQLHERMIVQGIGVDYTEGSYVVTMHVFDAVSAGQGSEGGTDEVQVLTAQGDSVLDAFTSITRQAGHEPLYSQNLVLILGEEVAKEGLEQVLDFFIRYYEARPDVNMFVARGLAADILNSEADGKRIQAAQIEDLSQANGLYAVPSSSTVMHVAAALESETASPNIAVLKKAKIGENDVISADGTALFHDGRMVGYLDHDQTRGMMLMMGETGGGTEVLEVEGVGRVTFSLGKNKSEITTKIENGLPVFTITVQTDANIYEIDRSVRDKLTGDSFRYMNEALKQRLEEECRGALQTCIMENRSDIFQFGKRVLQADPAYYREYVEGQWDTMMAKAQYHVQVDVSIKRVGQELNPLAYRAFLLS